VRPLRRRAARMARPARVRMRSRKPCVLARRRLFGWNVRLLTCTSPRWYVRGKGCTRTPPGTRSEPARAALRARRNCLLSSLDTVRRRADQGQTRPCPRAVDNFCGRATPSHQGRDAAGRRPARRCPQPSVDRAPSTGTGSLENRPPGRPRVVTCRIRSVSEREVSAPGRGAPAVASPQVNIEYTAGRPPRCADRPYAQ
jgi:hypothetical protein